MVVFCAHAHAPAAEVMRILRFLLGAEREN
jgi:hypothetical protein